MCKYTASLPRDPINNFGAHQKACGHHVSAILGLPSQYELGKPRGSGRNRSGNHCQHPRVHVRSEAVVMVFSSEAYM